MGPLALPAAGGTAAAVAPAAGVTAGGVKSSLIGSTFAALFPLQFKLSWVKEALFVLKLLLAVRQVSLRFHRVTYKLYISGRQKRIFVDLCLGCLS